jgi:hypothetical protein
VPNKTIDEKIDEMVLMVGRGLDEIRTEMRQGFVAINERFDGVDERLERIEFLVSAQDRRISILEDRMLQVSVKLGLQFNR